MLLPYSGTKLKSMDELIRLGAPSPRIVPRADEKITLWQFYFFVSAKKHLVLMIHPENAVILFAVACRIAWTNAEL